MKVLILRYAAIGDCVMSAWPATALKKALPEAEIHWAIQPRCADVVDQKNLAKAQVVPRDKKSGIGSWTEMLRFFRRLRSEKFDVGLDFQGHSKTALALRFASPAKRLAVRATDILARTLNPVALPPENLEHFVEKELWLVQHVAEAELPELPLMPDLADERARWKAMGKYISIQTGAGNEAKSYPPHYWQVVANLLGEQKIRVVGLGGPGDHPLSRTLNMAGKLSLSESMACVAESAVHLAADTGTGHIAAAYGVPVLTVFGPTEPKKCRPWGRSASIIKQGETPSTVVPYDVVDRALSLYERSA